METFRKAKLFVLNPQYASKRKKILDNFDMSIIDPPIIDLIQKLNSLPYCFSLQSCYGHFLHKNQSNAHNVEPLTNAAFNSKIEYRIAYIALCIENNEMGKKLYQDLMTIPQAAPDYIQFGSAEWFWQQHINSYILQVEPERFQFQDKITVNIDEALDLQTTRKLFFEDLKQLCRKYKQ